MSEDRAQALETALRKLELMIHRRGWHGEAHSWARLWWVKDVGNGGLLCVAPTMQYMHRWDDKRDYRGRPAIPTVALHHFAGAASQVNLAEKMPSDMVGMAFTFEAFGAIGSTDIGEQDQIDAARRNREIYKLPQRRESRMCHAALRSGEEATVIRLRDGEPMNLEQWYDAMNNGAGPALTDKDVRSLGGLVPEALRLLCGLPEGLRGGDLISE